MKIMGELFSCSDCDKVFSLQDNLEAHTSRIHRDVRLFECSDEPPSEGTSDEKPFSCTVCSLKFTRNDELRSHERIHAEIYTDVRLLECLDE